MQTKLTAVLFILLGINIQAQQTITGSIKSNGNPLSEVEISNLKTKATVKTNKEGFFNIEAEIGDEILLFKKNYEPLRFKITQNHITKHTLLDLNKNSILLDEVQIVKTPKIKITNNYDALKHAEIYKEQQTSKVVGVYDGKITNGIDFIGIGIKTIGLIKNIFNIEDKKPKLSFDQLVVKNVPTSFWTEQLQLKEDEVSLFLFFCKQDKEILLFNESSSSLDYIDFFLRKRKQFNPNH